MFINLLNFINFCVAVSFSDEITNIGHFAFNSSKRVVWAAVVAKLVIIGISPLTSFILALRETLVAKLVISGILSSIFLILALCTSFLTTLFLLHEIA